MSQASEVPFAQRARYALAALDTAQKPADGVPAYTRWVNRGAARRVVAVAYACGATPNQVSAASALISACGLAMLVLLPPGPLQALAVGSFLALGFVFDSADGQLARLQGSGSPRGEWLDHVIDAFRAPAMHVAAATAVVIHRPNMLPLAAVAVTASVVVSGQFMSQILAESVVTRAGSRVTRGGTLRSWVLLPSDHGLHCWVFALWALPSAFAFAYCALVLVALAHSAVSLRRRWRDLGALTSHHTTRRRTTTP